MSKQNVNDWTDKFGVRLEIGQTVAAVKGKSLHVGEVLWFTPKGVTMASLRQDGDTETISIMYDFGKTWSNRQGQHSFFVVS